MTIRRFFELWFPTLFVNKELEKLRATPDRSPELFRLMLNQIKGLQSASITVFTKIQKLEHRLSKYETDKRESVIHG